MPPPLTIIPPNESALCFLGPRSFREGLTPPTLCPRPQPPGFPNLGSATLNPPHLSRTPIPTPPFPSAPSQEAPGEVIPVVNILCTMGAGVCLSLLKRETGLRERGRSRQLQVPQWGAVKGPPSIVSRAGRGQGRGQAQGDRQGPGAPGQGSLFLCSTLGHSFMFMLSEHLLCAKPADPAARSGSDSKTPEGEADSR